MQARPKTKQPMRIGLATRKFRFAGLCGAPRSSRISVRSGLWLAFWLAVIGLPLGLRGADSFRAGPIFDEFDLTLASGHRTEALGPFYYREKQETQRLWAVPPLLSYDRDPDTDLEEFDFIYPLLTYDRYGGQHRWQFLQLFSFAGGPMPDEPARDRLTIFPVYFQQRSTDTNQDYTAVVPFYGHLKHRFFRDEIFFVMFPFYGQSRKADVVTDNYLFPFFHLRHGDRLHGWQFWPLAGDEHKDITTRTNGFGEVTKVGGHDKLFILWPFFFDEKSGLGTDNPQKWLVSFPAFGIERSPKRDSTSVLWLFDHVTDREKKYREWDTPWPFIVFARGEGKTANRVWPFFSRAHTPTLEADSYLWPVFKHSHFHDGALDRERSQFAFWLYSNMHEKNTETGASRQRLDLWPFLLHTREFNGNSRWQVLALIEAFTPGSHKIERDDSPLWSLWRQEKNPRTGASSQSLLWNLYRHDSSPAARKTSLLFGLYQYQADSQGKRVRLFYIPLGKAKTAAGKGPAADANSLKSGRAAS
jgi:hypothetical protein